MLHSIAMRSAGLSIVLVFAAAAACSDEKPNFGNAGGVLGRRLPGETGGAAPTAPGGEGLFPDKYDANKNKPAKTLKQGHATTGNPLAAAVTTPTVSSTCNQDGCHKTGGAAPPWLFGGRVLNAAKTAGEPNADVIVVNPDNKIVGGTYAKTDADGFFWMAVGADALADGAKTQVRTARGVPPAGGGTMSTPLKPDNGGQNDGGCDRTGSCHSQGSTGNITAK